MKNFAETIRKAREDKGFILRKVASITDIDQSIISKLEKESVNQQESKS